MSNTRIARIIIDAAKNVLGLLDAKGSILKLVTTKKDVSVAGFGLEADGVDAVQMEKASRAFRLRHFYKALYEGLNFVGGGFTRPKTLVRIGVFGDSVGNSKPAFVTKRLQGSLGNGGGFFNTVYSTAGATRTGDTNVGTYWINGSWFELPAGGNIQFAQNGGKASLTKLKLFYVREPGAGSFKVTTTAQGGSSVDEVGYTNVNAANATIDIGVIELTKGFDAYEMNVVGLTGTVRLIHCAWEDTTHGGVAVYNFDTGGLPLATAQQTPNALKLGVLNSLGLDLSFMEFKDGPEFAAALTSWGNVISQITKPCDWVFIGTTPELVEISSGSLDAVTNNALLKAFADANHFLYFDGYTPLLNFGVLTALGWGGDGTHLPTVASAYLAMLLWNFLGFDNLFEIPNSDGVRVDGSVASRSVEIANNSTLDFTAGNSLVGRMIMRSDVECYSSRGWLFKNFGEAPGAFIACDGGISTSFNGLGIGAPFGVNPIFHRYAADAAYLTNGANNGTPSASLGVKTLFLSSGARLINGSGSPEGVVDAPVGSLFTREDGGVSTTLYVKESGTGNTGWHAK